MENENNDPVNDQQFPPEAYHIPVMLHETIDALNIKPNGVYVDCTFGGGGHSRAILAKLNDEGILIAFDQDSDAQKNVPEDKRVIFVPQNFKYLQRFLRLHNYPQVDGILADLGVSSHQFNEAERGFSTRFDAALDMRMDNRNEKTAATVLADMSEKQLHKMFEQYGEVTNAKTLAAHIVKQREMVPFKTIDQFKQSLYAIVKGNPNKYFAQVFQALRIEVNAEMDALKEMLEQTKAVLKPHARLVIISFHSLEDRMVKNFMKLGTLEEIEEDDVYGTKPEKQFNIISKKPVTASAIELKNNPRSRSAKLRIAEKI